LPRTPSRPPAACGSGEMEKPMRKPTINPDLVIGLGGLAAGCLILLVWVPMDVETGLMEKVRGRVVIGDSLAPSLAAVVLMLGGLMLTFQSYRASGGVVLTWKSLKYVGLTLSILALSMAMMRWSGPLAAWIFGGDYRNLRDMIPWKYTGFFLGGATLVFGLITMIEGRVRLRVFVISLLAVLILMMLYDLPFKNLQLPPNGDV